MPSLTDAGLREGLSKSNLTTPSRYPLVSQVFPSRSFSNMYTAFTFSIRFSPSPDFSLFAFFIFRGHLYSRLLLGMSVFTVLLEFKWPQISPRKRNMHCSSFLSAAFAAAPQPSPPMSSSSSTPLSFSTPATSTSVSLKQFLPRFSENPVALPEAFSSY